MEYHNFNYCFPSASSLSKKLTIVTTTTTLTLLLIVTIVVFADEQYCGLDKPLGYGPCITDSSSCVTNLLTDLGDVSSFRGDYKIFASRPYGDVSGGFKGQAICTDGSAQADCQSCISGAKEWLRTNCVSYFSSGNYSYGICSMSFEQIP